MSPPLKPPPKNIPGFPRGNLPRAVEEVVVSSTEARRPEPRKTALPPPDEPPEPLPQLPKEKPPSMFARVGAGAWTPTAIAGAIVLVVGALGGVSGLSTLMGASEATRREIRESEERTKKAIEAAVDQVAKREISARAEIGARQTVTEQQVAMHAGLHCKQNGGKPHESWPCDGFRAATKSAKEAKKPPLYITELPYPTASKAP